MTKEELAEELYNLIVIKGRFNGVPRENPLFGGEGYEFLPRGFKYAWEEMAIDFAYENGFELT